MKSLSLLLLVGMSISLSFGNEDDPDREARLQAEHEYHVQAMADRYEQAINSCQKIDGAITLTRNSSRSDSELECTDYKCALNVADSFSDTGWQTACRMRNSRSDATANAASSDLNCNISESNPRSVNCSDGKTYSLDGGSTSNSNFDEAFHDLAGESQGGTPSPNASGH